MNPNANASPTVSEFLNAANWMYQKTGLPADLQPLIVNGHQLTFANQRDGISADAWVTPDRQVIVSYEGTQAISFTAAAADPAFSFRQVVEDTGIAQGNVTAGEKDAAAFATTVVAAAAAQGITAADVFVTGHSLGGIQAEYAAQQTGLGGIAFESTGIPRSATAKGDGTNFVNVVQYGDPVANYSSDITAEQPFAPAYAPGGTGALPHYGYVAMIGDPAAQAVLSSEAKLSAASSIVEPIGVGLTTAAYGIDLVSYHVPNVQAYNLGVALTQYGASEVAGVRSGPVLQASADTIEDLIQATHAAYSAPIAPIPTISPTSGAYAGAAAMLLHSASDFAQTTHLAEAAALVDQLVLPAGGINTASPGLTNSAVEQLLMAGESHIAGTLSHTLDSLAANGLASVTDHLHLQLSLHLGALA